jgi:hypothetical protein
LMKEHILSRSKPKTPNKPEAGKTAEGTV